MSNPPRVVAWFSCGGRYDGSRDRHAPLGGRWKDGFEAPMTPSPEAGQYCKHFSQNFKDKSKACPQCCYEEAMKSRDVIARLREEAKAAEKVVEAAKKTWTSLVPFNGSINTIPIPGIKSRCRVNDGRYTIPAISDELFSALATYDARAKQERP